MQSDSLAIRVNFLTALNSEQDFQKSQSNRLALSTIYYLNRAIDGA